jgi:hypothetical protein
MGFIPPLLFLTSLLLQAEDGAEQPRDSRFRTIEWIELMPQDDLDALLNPPESLDDIADGSVEDQISSQMQLALEQTSDRRYQQALISQRVVLEFDGQAIRLPGFIVPLAFNEDQQLATKFFLVPYFGACIHMPPPPPNQIVYAEYDKGIEINSLYQPYWLLGVLSTSLTENDMATAAYSIKVEKVELYVEE